MAQSSVLMNGKRGVIMGVANNRSISMGHREGLGRAGRDRADMAGRRFEEARRAAGAGAWCLHGRHCDVTDLTNDRCRILGLEEKWGKIDFVVHAIAFSDKTN